MSIRELIEARWPGRFALDALREDVPLGEEGLGLDSLEVVEVIFACEDHWGKTMSQKLFTSSPLTIARLVDELSGA